MFSFLSAMRKTLAAVVTLAAIMAYSAYAEMPELFVDNLNHDFRLIPGSKLIDSGKDFADAGSFSFDMVFTWSTFLDARITFASKDTVVFKNDSLVKNTFGNAAKFRMKYTADTRPVYELTIVKNCLHNPSTVHLWHNKRNGPLPDKYEIFKAALNYAACAWAGAKDLPVYGDTITIDVTPDTEAPSRVQGVKTTWLDSANTHVSWNKNTETDLVRYKIYRAPPYDPLTTEQVGTVPASDTSVTLSEMVIPRTLYMVIAYDSTGHQSPGLFTPFYREPFDSAKSLAERGFTDISYWDSADGHMTSSSPGGWQALSEIYSKPFSVKRTDGTVVVDYKVQFPTDHGKSWREENKLWVALYDSAGQNGYRLLFKPNRKQDQYTSFDLELKRIDNGKSTLLKQGWTHTVTPHGSNASWVKLRLALHTNRKISVYYDNGTENMQKYLETTDAGHSEFTKLYFKYKTGTGNENYYINVDDIDVYVQ